MTNNMEAIDIDSEPGLRRIVDKLWHSDNSLWLRENGEIVALIAGVIDFSGMREEFDAPGADDDPARKSEDNEQS